MGVTHELGGESGITPPQGQCTVVCFGGHFPSTSMAAAHSARLLSPTTSTLLNQYQFTSWNIQVAFIWFLCFWVGAKGVNYQWTNSRHWLQSVAPCNATSSSSLPWTSSAFCLHSPGQLVLLRWFLGRASIRVPLHSSWFWAMVVPQSQETCPTTPLESEKWSVQ